MFHIEASKRGLFFQIKTNTRGLFRLYGDFIVYFGYYILHQSNFMKIIIIKIICIDNVFLKLRKPKDD